jgi:simple sugar transport system permease protein
MSSTAASEPPAPAPAGGPAQERSAPRHAAAPTRALIKRALTAREGSIVVVTVLLAVYFAVSLPSSSNFVSVSNLQSLLPYFAPYAILAAGLVFLLINGEIDLSIGGVYLFTPLMFYELVGGGIPWVPAVILALAICCVIGLVNGVITAVFGVNSFITTLGTLFTLSGLTLIVSHAEQLEMPGATVTSNASGNHTTTFANVFGAGTYSELVWALLIVIVLQLALTRTRWGLHTIAVGSNRIAAAEAGVKVRWVLIRNFIVCSTCAGLVGILESVRTDSISPDPGSANAILLDAIAAAVIGGTLLAGGSGTVVGAMIGALFLGILQDGLAIKGVNADYLEFYLGLAILFAMLVNVYLGRVRTRSHNA